MSADARLAHLATDAMKECLEQKPRLLDDNDAETVELALDKLTDRPRAVNDPALINEMAPASVDDTWGPRSRLLYRCYRVLGYSHKLAFAMSYEASARQ
jgi:hypothetical protein